MIVVKILAAVVAAGFLAWVAFVSDAVWNDSRLFYFAAGRDTLVAACSPPTREALQARGFSPTDLVIADHPSIAFTAGSAGRSRVLSGAFTFSDGPNGPGVDGYLVCSVHGASATVQVDVKALPMRAA